MKELKKIIKTLLKENYSDKYKELKNFVLDSIEFEDKDVSDEDKINVGLETFESEYGFMIKRYGLKKAFIEYIQGLPSWLDIPYYYDEMRDLLYALGFDEVKDMDDSDVSKLYYDEISDVFLN